MKVVMSFRVDSNAWLRHFISVHTAWSQPSPELEATGHYCARCDTAFNIGDVGNHVVDYGALHVHLLQKEPTREPPP